MADRRGRPLYNRAPCLWPSSPGIMKQYIVCRVKNLSDPKSASSYRSIKLPSHSGILSSYSQGCELLVTKVSHSLNTTDVTCSCGDPPDFQLNLYALHRPWNFIITGHHPSPLTAGVFLSLFLQGV